MNVFLTTGEILSSSADIATILGGGTAVFAFIFGLWQFTLTQKATRESQAVDLYIKWNQLNIDQARHQVSAKEEASAASQALESNPDHWYGNCKIAITEALYELRGCSREWRSTIAFMLSQQEKADIAYIGKFNIKLTKQHVPYQ